ncbi:MAG: putative lipopolysaccharide heptosyltransferase III [Thermodesulfobacteriota bacterium]
MSGGFGNVLIIKLKHLGDVLTTTPVITGIKALWPEAKVSYLINPGGEDLVKYHPEVSEVFIFPRNRGFGARVSLVRALRNRRFDLVLELSGGDRGAFLAWTTGASTRVGYDHKKDFRGRRLTLTHRVTTPAASLHTVEYHLETLRVLGADPGYQPLSLHWPAEAQERVRERLAAGGRDPDGPYAVVHPSSRWMFKTWRPEGNAEVIDFLSREKGLPVVVTSAPEEKELAFVRDVLARTTSPPLDLSGCLSLAELAALIGGARVFFGVDSLPMHMAAAAGTKVVALFGPSGEHMWGPWGRGHRVVAKDWDCRPCGRDGCQGSKVSRCLVEIETPEVTAALEAVLEGRA